MSLGSFKNAINKMLGLVLWHINYYWLFNAKSCFYIYIKYIWFVNTFFSDKKLNDQTVIFLTIQFSLNQQRKIIPYIAIYR